MKTSQEMIERLKQPRTAICSKDSPESWDPFPEWEPCGISLVDVISDLEELQRISNART